MSTHTRGPWSISNDTDISGIENDIENNCFGIVDVAHVYLLEVEGKHEANSRLIAAAPDLLHEGKTLIKALKTMAINPIHYAALELLIANAEGKS